MFGHPPPWDRDIHSLLSMRSHRHPSHDQYPSYPPHDQYSSYPPPLPDHPTLPDPHPRQPSHRKAHKQARFSHPATPSTSDLSSSEREHDAYSLDTDSDSAAYALPGFAPRGRHAGRAFERAPDVQGVRVRVSSSAAEELGRGEVLILPTLAHLRIRIRTGWTAGEEVLRAAVPETMRFGDVVERVVAMYLGDGVGRGGVRAWVKRRGRWDEPSQSAKLGELAHRGEMFGGARSEMDVKIEVDDGGRRERANMRSGGRGPRGSGFGVERVVRSESMVRMRAGAY